MTFRIETPPPPLGMVAGDHDKPRHGRHLLYSIWGDRLCEAPADLRGLPVIEANSDGSAFDPSVVCFECIALACLAAGVKADACPCCRAPWTLDEWSRPVHARDCSTQTVVASGRAFRVMGHELIGSWEWRGRSNQAAARAVPR